MHGNVKLVYFKVKTPKIIKSFLYYVIKNIEDTKYCRKRLYIT